MKLPSSTDQAGAVSPNSLPSLITRLTIAPPAEETDASIATVRDHGCSARATT